MEAARAAEWYPMLLPLQEIDLPTVRGCPPSMNASVNEDNMIIIQGDEIGGTSPHVLNSPAKETKRSPHDDTIKSLSTEEVKELYTVFVRVDKERSGIVEMTEYINTMNKMKAVDDTGILKRSYGFLRRSLGQSKLISFRSFKAIIEILIPALSSNEVDDLLLRTERAKGAGTISKSTEKFQKITKLGIAMKRVGDLNIPDEPDDEQPESRRPMTVQNGYELREMFDVLAPGGAMHQQDFYDATADIMNHNERIEFFNKYVKRHRGRLGLETTKMGLQLAQYKADFPTFTEMVVPRGYSMPELPDPERHVATPDELWTYVYTRDAPKETGLHKGTREEKFRKLPKIKRLDKAGLPLPSRIYDAKEVLERRQLMHHVAIDEPDGRNGFSLR
jgi:hypothetical protein